MLQEKMLQFALGGAEWVLWLLVVLSVVCVGIAIERGLYLVLNSAPTAAFEGAVGAYLKGGSRAEAERLLAAMKGMEPRVLLAGFAAGTDGGEDAMAGTLAFEKLRMERGLLVIGTVAANAAYIGLFGTVIGILKAFNDLSIATDSKMSEGAAPVMAGISEALVSTAAGLMVAILSVVLFNFLTRRVKAITSRAGSIGSLVLSRMYVEQAA
jgi:biopolymer transport protein ExbB